MYHYMKNRLRNSMDITTELYVCVCDVCSESKQEKRQMSRKMSKILAKTPG